MHWRRFRKASSLAAQSAAAHALGPRGRSTERLDPLRGRLPLGPAVSAGRARRSWQMQIPFISSRPRQWAGPGRAGRPISLKDPAAPVRSAPSTWRCRNGSIVLRPHFGSPEKLRRRRRRRSRLRSLAAGPLAQWPMIFNRSPATRAPHFRRPAREGRSGATPVVKGGLVGKRAPGLSSRNSRAANQLSP